MTTEDTSCRTVASAAVTRSAMIRSLGPTRSTGPKTTTRKTLWGLCLALLIATAMVFGTSLWVFTKVHDTVRAVRISTAPAIIEVLAARSALVAADTAAIASFRDGETQLTGPGQQYQNQLAFASQSLAQVAEDNAAGDPSSQTIQLVEALLVSYSGLIGQADADFRQETGTTLGITDLWYASRLLRATPNPAPGQDNGILAQLDGLLSAQKEALDAQVSASRMTVSTVLIWALPIVILFVLLGVTQILLRRRFRRILNPLLLLATALLVGLSAVTYLAYGSQHQLEEARKDLHQLADDWSTQTAAADTQRHQALTDLVTRECQRPDSGCGATVTEFSARITPVDSPATEVDVRENTRLVNERIDLAGQNAGLQFLIPLLTSLIAALILLGLLPHIEEYRYRPR